MRRQLGLPAKLRPTLSSGVQSVARSLDDSLPFVFRHGAQQSDETAAERRGQIQVRLVEHLHEAAARMDPLDDGDTVQHRARGAIPLGDDEHVAGAEFIDGLLELRATLGVLAARLLAEDEIALSSAMRPRPRGVVRSRCGLSSTFTKHPRE